ncbi:hypothetical protein SAMN04488033_11965, partial [Salegentibacter agarivorans]
LPIRLPQDKKIKNSTEFIDVTGAENKGCHPDEPSLKGYKNTVNLLIFSVFCFYDII